MRYKPVGKDCATRISRWGMGTIRIVWKESEIVIWIKLLLKEH
jgi:hypothetical protein